MSDWNEIAQSVAEEIGSDIILALPIDGKVDYAFGNLKDFSAEKLVPTELEFDVNFKTVKLVTPDSTELKFSYQERSDEDHEVKSGFFVCKPNAPVAFKETYFHFINLSNSDSDPEEAKDYDIMFICHKDVMMLAVTAVYRIFEL
ncbi:MAG: hypothetical protein MHPSP_000288 [Paramarteilia canceri]